MAALKRPYGDRGHIGLTVALLLSGIFSLFVTSSAATNPAAEITHFSTGYAFVAVLVVLAVDVYVCFLVAATVDLADKRENDPNAKAGYLGLPNRGPACVILALLFAALVFAFARINQATGLNVCTSNAEAAFQA